MKSCAAIFLLLFLFALSAVGQAAKNADCPSLSVAGPLRIVNPGDLATYTANVDTGGKRFDLTYVWTMIGDDPPGYGEAPVPIVKGQGTASITVRQPKHKLIVSVEVKGLPAGCSNKATETVITEAAPEAVKIFELPATAAFDQITLEKITSVIRPSDGFQILSGTMRCRKPEAVREKLAAIVKTLVAAGLERSQIATVETAADCGPIQFWLVPPGAESPTGMEQTMPEMAEFVKDCPKISVTGPAGILDAGDAFEFSANISGSVPNRVRYFWTVKDASAFLNVPSGTRLKSVEEPLGKATVSGQGTLNLSVRFPRNEIVQSLTAILEVDGIPARCPRTASERYVVAIDYLSPILFDEYGKIATNRERKKLSSAVVEGKQYTNDFLYILMYFLTEGRYARARIAQVENYLTGPLKLQRNGFKILKVIGKREITRIYFVPPGAENPMP